MQTVVTCVPKSSTIAIGVDFIPQVRHVVRRTELFAGTMQWKLVEKLDYFMIGRDDLDRIV